MKKGKSSPSNTGSTQINNFQNKINQTTARYIIVKLKNIRIRRKILKPGRGCIKKQIHEVRNPEFVRMATLRRGMKWKGIFQKVLQWFCCLISLSKYLKSLSPIFAKFISSIKFIKNRRDPGDEIFLYMWGSSNEYREW